MSTGAERRAQIARFVERAFTALDNVDYYRILNVSSAASEDEIRASYYRMASSLHPDIHGTEIEPQFRLKLTAVFSRVVEAYKVLTDPRKRQAYDRGLARGRLRLAIGAEVGEDNPEQSINNPSALRFYKLAAAAKNSGDVRSALMNLRLALSMEPNNETLKRELAELEKA